MLRSGDWNSWRKFFRRFPFIGALFSFGPDAHWATFKKFLFLWVLSTLPVILSTLFSAIPVGPESLWDKFIVRLGPGFSLREQFVYSASFLAPILYIAVDNIRQSDGKAKPEANFQIISRHVFSGFSLVYGVSVVLLLLAAAAHAFLVTQKRPDEVFFFAFAERYSIWIYVWALYAWYLSLLDDKTPKNSDLVKQTRESEDQATGGLEARLRRRAAAGE